MLITRLTALARWSFEFHLRPNFTARKSVLISIKVEKFLHNVKVNEGQWIFLQNAENHMMLISSPILHNRLSKDEMFTQLICSAEQLDCFTITHRCPLFLIPRLVIPRRANFLFLFFKTAFGEDTSIEVLKIKWSVNRSWNPLRIFFVSNDYATSLVTDNFFLSSRSTFAKA